MQEGSVLFLLLICTTAGPATAATAGAAVSGRIVITKAITRKRVVLPSYDLRGVAVRTENAGQPAGGDPNASELSRVIIYLEGPGVRPAPPTRSTMTQKDRRFEPDIVVIPVGSSVSFPNEDPIFHNVFSLSKVKGFDLGYYPAGETRTVKFDRAGIVQVYCHIHPDMSGAIVVLATGAWTRPAADGSYTLSGISPGTYDLIAWHRSAGFFRRHITIGEGTAQAEDFVIPVKELNSAESKSGGGQ